MSGQHSILNHQTHDLVFTTVERGTWKIDVEGVVIHVNKSDEVLDVEYDLYCRDCEVTLSVADTDVVWHV